MKVSIVIPVYNERAFIEEVLLRVQAVQLDKEILVIDDGSTDGTRALLQEFEQAQSAGQHEVPVQNGKALLALEGIRFLFQDRNQGKGAALRRGFKAAPARSSWCRMPTSNTIRGTTRNCWRRFSTAAPTSCTARVSWEGRSGSITSGITSVTTSSPCFPTC